MNCSVVKILPYDDFLRTPFTITSKVKPIIIICLEKTNLCSKNLTFPKAERDQQCSRLVLIVFVTFYFNLPIRFLFAGMN